MEHRCSIRKPIEFQLLLYKQGIPVQTGMCRNLGLGGLLMETGSYQWRKNEYLEVEIVAYNGRRSIRLPAVVAHCSARGVGLMFDGISSEHRRILRGWLFSGRNGWPTGADAPKQDPRRVA